MSGRLGQVATLARLRREQRTRRRVDADTRLRLLLDHAASRSPYYKDVLVGREHAPFTELPALTKDVLAERFDDVVTDARIRRAEVESFVASAPPAGTPFLGRYRVAASSGSTGRPGLVVFDPDEWAALLAASAAARRVAGPPSGGAGVRSVKVGSSSPWHLSSQLGATLQDPRRPTLRLPVTTPIDELTASLAAFGPDILTAYPSVLVALAGEQLAGRLSIAPRQVFGGGEVLAPSARALVREAWGSEPFDQYMTTEAGPVAAECPAHAGLHVLADHVVLEVVDDHRRPVPPGTYGAAVLVTVLSSRTLPLVRYELADSVMVEVDPCPCGRAGPRIASIAGRAREVLQVPGRAGTVAVHPAVLTAVLDTAAVAAWQVVQEGHQLRVLAAGPRAGFDPERLRSDLIVALGEVGAPGVTVDVEEVDALPRTRAGKAERFVVRGA